MKDLNSLIPQHKNDMEKVDEIIQLGYPKIKPILAQLLEWIQDMNWPVAQRLAPFLASIGSDLIPEIKGILKNGDYIWQYWCLSQLVTQFDKDGILKLEKELLRLKDFPSRAEMDECLHKIAAKILAMLDNDI